MDGHARPRDCAPVLATARCAKPPAAGCACVADHAIALGVPPLPGGRGRTQQTETAMMRDVLLAVRADEANHRDVNHTFSDLQQGDQENPFNLKPH